MLSTILDTVFNGLLIGSSGYAMLSLNPAECPFAFAASALGFCHGCTGLYSLFMDSEGKDAEGKQRNRVLKLTTSCMEFTSTALTNIDLYRSSQQTSALALGHGLFIVPLAFDLTFKLFGTGEDDDEATGYLKDLTAIGNIVSLMFFAVNESNIPAGIMTFAAFLAYSGSMMMESILAGTEQNTGLAGYALFYGFLPLAIKAADSTVTS